MAFEDEYALIKIRERIVASLREVDKRLFELRGPRRRGEYRIALRPDEHGADPMSMDTLLDDIVVNGVKCFRAEQMSPDTWWACCYLDDDEGGDRIAFHIQAHARPRRLTWQTVEYPEMSLVYEHDMEAAGSDGTTETQGSDG